MNCHFMTGISRHPIAEINNWSYASGGWAGVDGKLSFTNSVLK